MSCPRTDRNLTNALNLAYPGPAKAKRLAKDMGCSESTAKNLLNGLIPSAIGRFLALIEKRPVVLAHALKTTWAEELTIRAEINETRGRILEWEKRLATQNKTLSRTTTEPHR
jgi:hypothetical protein